MTEVPAGKGKKEKRREKKGRENGKGRENKEREGETREGKTGEDCRFVIWGGGVMLVLIVVIRRGAHLSYEKLCNVVTEVVRVTVCIHCLASPIHSCA